MPIFSSISFTRFLVCLVISFYSLKYFFSVPPISSIVPGPFAFYTGSFVVVYFGVISRVFMPFWAFSYTLLVQSYLIFCVLHVIFLSSQKQMPGSYTPRVVTFMAHKFTHGYFTLVNHIRRSVRGFVFTVKPESSIWKFINSVIVPALPHPTSAGLFYESKESGCNFSIHPRSIIMRAS